MQLEMLRLLHVSLALLACSSNALEAAEACGDEVCSLKSKTSGWKNGVFVLDNKPVVRETLGHCSWTFLHSTAAYLPNTKGVLGAATKHAFVSLVLSLRKVYACSLCRHHFDALLRAQPKLVTKLKAIKTRDDAVFWLTVVHNLVTIGRYKGQADQPADRSIKGLFPPSSKAMPAQIEGFTNGLLMPYLHYESSAVATQMHFNYDKGVVTKASLWRWSWKEHNAHVAQLAKEKAAANKKDPFDVRMEEQITKNDEAAPVVFGQACKSMFASPGSAFCGKVRRTAAAMGTRGRLPFHAFVMGRCPWCAQWMSFMKPLFAGMGDRLDTSLSFILDKSLIGTPKRKSLDQNTKAYFRANTWHGYSSMHGRLEAAADAYELCAEKHYKAAGSTGGVPLWMDYIECMDAKFDEAGPATSKVCAKKLGLDDAKLRACAVSPEGAALLDKSIRLFNVLNIESAPSFMIGNHSMHSGVVGGPGMLKLLCPSLACLDDEFKAKNPQAWRAEQALTERLAASKSRRLQAINAPASDVQLRSTGYSARQDAPVPATTARDPLLGPLAAYASAVTLLLLRKQGGAVRQGSV